jgi:hypothetical protein
MNWDSFNTYGLGSRDAFETLNNQLFEHYVRRNYASTFQSFRAINGSGGDGGIEAYATFKNGEVIAVQSKWFRTSLGDSEISQIRGSITTARTIRNQIKKYIICIPHDVNSKKIGRGKKVTKKEEESKINALVDEIAKLYPDLELIWWFDHELLAELQEPDNEGVHKYWFEKEVLSISYLKDQFELAKKNYWLKERYIPKLHANGTIDRECNKLLFDKNIREKLANDLEHTTNKLINCNKLIDEYLLTNEFSNEIKIGLENIKSNLVLFIAELSKLKEAAEKNDEDYHTANILEYDIWPITILLEKTSSTNRQKQLRLDIIKYLRDIHGYKLPDYLVAMNQAFNQTVRLIYGKAGSGKTHGLAECVQKHLVKNQPGIIIQAKGTPCRNWTEILCHTLEITGWNKDEILVALEAMAISQDHTGLRVAIEKGITLQETSKVLICIDGLEEEIEDSEEWYSRISETELITKNHPRVRFIFSAREYFKRICIDDTIVPSYKEIDLPLDGDVSVSQVAQDYFKEYDITIVDPQFVRHLDSLLALRLFCDLYRGQTIGTGDAIATATGELLQLKIKRINTEYVKTLSQPKGVTQQPIFEALLVIAEDYYHATVLEHSVLSEHIQNKIGASFSLSEIDLLLDFLVQHGILIRISKKEGKGLLARSIHSYRITYQSIIEHILSEKIFQDINEKKLAAIPKTMQYEIAIPLGNHQPKEYHESPPNEQIIQSIVNRLFVENGTLIGENNFLTEGFDAEAIQRMQLTAIAKAPYEIAIKYKTKIDNLFLGGPYSQYAVLTYVIIPSSRNVENAFGAEYLHNILMEQPSAFERDKLWSGLDSWEQTEETKHYSNNIKEVLDEYGTGIVVLTGFEKYNETPLLYSWGLSNIDQSLRNRLRIALTKWALKRPEEFLKLLDKVFFCNDPQIQEDLASITLGIAGLLKDKESITKLAKWALDNVFTKKEQIRNVVIRQGFRAMVERAKNIGGILESEAALSRPIKMTNPPIIDFEHPLLSGKEGEAYPIVHDLAWYVINRSYDKFLEYPMGMTDGLKDNDGPEAKELLDLYRSQFNNPSIYAFTWAMCAAIGYIRKKLGLTRTEGNEFTDESHGSKSKVYTYEEKYTWLAVHHLQGYLSDYLPYSEFEESPIYVQDYSQLNDIPNPGEDVAMEKNLLLLAKTEKLWVIKEDLVPTINTDSNVAENIRIWTDSEPTLDFSKWIQYSYSDFKISDKTQRGIVISNRTVMHDSSQLGFARIDVTACLSSPETFILLKEKINFDADSLNFIRHLDHLEASPDTSTYSNPSDIVWMDWIAELNNLESFNYYGEEHEILFTLTGITQGTVNGEKYFQIPSKKVRQLLGIKSFREPLFQNEEDETVAFIHEVSDGSYKDSQKILLVNSNIFFDQLKAEDLEIFWWVEVFKQKNPLFKPDNDYPHSQKTYKYLVWKEEENFHHILFWNERFSNQREEEGHVETEELEEPIDED